MMVNFKWRVIVMFSFLLMFCNSQAQKKRLQQGKVKRLVIMQKKQSNANLVKQREEVLDRKGNTIEELEFDDEGEIENKISYKYDTFNNLVEKEVYARDKNGNSKTTVLKEKRLYVYNGFNELAEEFVYDEKAKLEKKYVYEYNRFKLLTQRTTYNIENKVIQVKKYLYEKF